MALILSLNINPKPKQQQFSLRNPSINSNQNHQIKLCFPSNRKRRRQQLCGSEVVNCLDKESGQSSSQDEEAYNLGVKVALSMLRFYKREISPLLPNSCRFVPTCSEYSMIAYKKYGVVKGTVLTACRLCRCNPLGGSGFDPPRWFDEASPPEY